MRLDDERSQARERALSILYEAQSKGVAPSEVVAALPLRPDAFTLRLVLGVQEHQARLDSVIQSHAKNWTIERMPLLDVSIMRIAAFELEHEPETPTAVIINEAVELAKRFSTDDSGRFVNGLLSSAVVELRPANG